MKRKRLLMFFALFCLVSSFVCPLVFAFEMTYQYDVITVDYNLSVSYAGGICDNFVGTGRYLVSFDLYLHNVTGSITSGYYQAFIATSLTGNGTMIENSTNTLSAGVLSNTAAWYGFNFTGNTKLQTGVTYYLGFWITDVGGVGGGGQASVGCYSGNAWAKLNADGAWAATGTQGLGIRAYTSNAAGQGAVATAVPGSSLPPDGSWFTGAGAAELFAWIAVLLLMLIPPFILGVYMRGGKWGFLIGLAVGTGLSYFVFPALVPIWLVILVAIGLGAAFLTSVREGG